MRDHWMPLREGGTAPFMSQPGPLDANQRALIHWAKIYEDAMTNLPEEKRGPRFVEDVLSDPTKCDIFFARLRREQRRDVDVAAGRRRVRPRGHVREIDFVGLESMLSPRQAGETQAV